MKIEVIKATLEQKPILANLLELYTYDFTEFSDFEIGSNGYYGYTYLPLYWTELNRHPYLIYVEDNLAGFALIQKGSFLSENKDIWDMTEFFIMKKYRRKKIGSRAVVDLWNHFKGRWQVRVLLSNKRALLFWSNTINLFTKKNIIPTEIETKKDVWFVYQFESN